MPAIGGGYYYGNAMSAAPYYVTTSSSTTQINWTPTPAPACEPSALEWLDAEIERTCALARLVKGSR
jgi:hypothetical protein